MTDFLEVHYTLDTREISVSRVSLKAVVSGVLLVLFLDILWSVGLLVLLAGHVFVEGRSDEQIAQSLQAVTTSMRFLLLSAFFGTLTTIVGGYVAARISKKFPYFNGLAIGVVGVLYGIALWTYYPLWFDLLGLFVVVPAALLGAHIAARRSIARA